MIIVPQQVQQPAVMLHKEAAARQPAHTQNPIIPQTGLSTSKLSTACEQTCGHTKPPTVTTPPPRANKPKRVKPYSHDNTYIQGGVPRQLPGSASVALAVQHHRHTRTHGQAPTPAHQQTTRYRYLLNNKKRYGTYLLYLSTCHAYFYRGLLCGVW